MGKPTGSLNPPIYHPYFKSMVYIWNNLSNSTTSATSAKFFSVIFLGFKSCPKFSFPPGVGERSGNVAFLPSNTATPFLKSGNDGQKSLVKYFAIIFRLNRIGRPQGADLFPNHRIGIVAPRAKSEQSHLRIKGLYGSTIFSMGADLNVVFMDSKAFLHWELHKNVLDLVRSWRGLVFPKKVLMNHFQNQ